MQRQEIHRHRSRSGSALHEMAHPYGDHGLGLVPNGQHRDHRRPERQGGKLDTFIDNIRLHDGTGTMSGMKYGLMLLNPSHATNLPEIG